MNIKEKLWLNKANKKAITIENKRKELENKSDTYLIDTLKSIKKEVKKGKSLDSVLIDVFAIVAEASRRTTGMIPYKVQHIAGIGIHEGKCLEMKTGEGKTLTIAMPAVLHSLNDKGVHVVTVNPYLCQRDAENIGRIYSFLDISYGYVIPDMSVIERKKAYNSEITYVSNTELGFDYLKSNMATTENNVIVSNFEFAIVDEIDSILIDEAKTPLIISGDSKDVTIAYTRVNEVISKLHEGTETFQGNKFTAFADERPEVTGDYIVHEKDRTVLLTPQGIEKVEAALQLKNYADVENSTIQHIVHQCLHAHALMKKDKDYLVKDNKVYIIDSSTGRIQEGRQFSNGLHQAIEAKEHVPITEVSETVATTTYQNFFRKYNLLSGMSGTVATERKEFKKTYNLDIIVIPTNKKVKRIDTKELLFLNADAKHKAICKEIIKAVEKGQPVLAGTASVEESEELSSMLKSLGIKHQVLNAKQDKNEANIISKAGKAGTVTISTNMAGRGTDIVLDEEAKKNGGLLVIGTERQESARIDNQLRGRAGRQGDPGISKFFCSLDDRVIRLYSPEKNKELFKNANFDADKPEQLNSYLSQLNKTQKKVSLDNFAARRNTLEFDDVNNAQREIIYKMRNDILNQYDCSKEMREAMTKAIDNLVENYEPKDWIFAFTINTGIRIQDDVDITKMDKKFVKKCFLASCDYEIGNMRFENEEQKASHIRETLLRAIDSAWAEQIKALEYLQDSVAYVQYGQLDPKAIYAKEAYNLFLDMNKTIYDMALYLFFHTRPDKNLLINGISVNSDYIDV